MITDPYEPEEVQRKQKDQEVTTASARAPRRRAASTADEVRALAMILGQMVQAVLELNRDLRSTSRDLAVMTARLAALEGHHAKPHWLTPFAEDPYVRRGILMVLLAMFCLSTGTCAAISLKDSGIMHSAIEATAPAIGVPHE